MQSLESLLIKSAGAQRSSKDSLQPITVAIQFINQVDNTKFPCFTC